VNMISRKYVYVIACLSILISLLTWFMDFSHLVGPCIYCRSERTIIGMLGLIMLFPIVPYFTRLLSYIIGFFGAHVAAQQILTNIMQYQINEELILAICALVFIIVQVMFIHYYSEIKKPSA
ncbi:MAG TPA: hypothetical protein VKR58_10775, partial [Aquella sp.]|nr:hypothetical protein [Aquella sp.]